MGMTWGTVSQIHLKWADLRCTWQFCPSIAIWHWGNQFSVWHPLLHPLAFYVVRWGASVQILVWIPFVWSIVRWDFKGTRLIYLIETEEEPTSCKESWHNCSLAQKIIWFKIAIGRVHEEPIGNNTLLRLDPDFAKRLLLGGSFDLTCWGFLTWQQATKQIVDTNTTFQYIWTW
jgi:hypothetical protein